MKRKFMMLSMLISSPRQPGDDTGTYLATLIEDLTLMTKWSKASSKPSFVVVIALKKSTFKIQSKGYKDKDGYLILLTLPLTSATRRLQSFSSVCRHCIASPSFSIHHGLFRTSVNTPFRNFFVSCPSLSHRRKRRCTVDEQFVQLLLSCRKPEPLPAELPSESCVCVCELRLPQLSALVESSALAKSYMNHPFVSR
ncbi:transposase [Cucumis melo var. makuwa]|uniref:Transposase n=1 Tax=Cucumis melo var. makuwa TaxID=1194695 RepID=A0A5A7T3Q8_CUCMM|nr:transposase [Cucumis melo var. makuwa]